MGVHLTGVYFMGMLFPRLMAVTADRSYFAVQTSSTQNRSLLGWYRPYQFAGDPLRRTILILILILILVDYWWPVPCE